MKPYIATGPKAGSMKYDMLTMLSVAGLHGSPTLQTSMLRLVALVTARYNWRLDEVSVGQRDMARLWAVNERTVKREIKRLTENGILVCKRQGVKGRVGAYRLNHSRIAELSNSTWADVGPDFEYRMNDRYQPDQTVVPLRVVSQPKKIEGKGPWVDAMAEFAKDHPDVWNSWFSKLEYLGCDAGILHLKAPTAFLKRYVETHLSGQLVDAVRPALGSVNDILVEV